MGHLINNVSHPRPPPPQKAEFYSHPLLIAGLIIARHLKGSSLHPAPSE